MYNIHILWNIEADVIEANRINKIYLNSVKRIEEKVDISQMQKKGIGYLKQILLDFNSKIVKL